MYWPLQRQHLMKSPAWGSKGQCFALSVLSCVLKGSSLGSFPKNLKFWCVCRVRVAQGNGDAELLL